eukprot:14488942-Alexandrium_andersonii.AAC.1
MSASLVGSEMCIRDSNCTYSTRLAQKSPRCYLEAGTAPSPLYIHGSQHCSQEVKAFLEVLET